MGTTATWPHRRLYVDDATDVETAAEAAAGGAVVATAFGNFYVIVTRPDAATVRGVNVAKGRPIDQVGSITAAFDQIPTMYDWTKLPTGLDETAVRALMDALWVRGPFGFRGPAAAHVPDHLTQVDHGVRTTQVIAPGEACPSNAFFTRTVERTGASLLYITSANRSRHLTGADEEPAHWRAAGIVDDFAHVPNLVALEHRDEAAARAAYPAYVPTSVTLMSFHTYERGERPILTIDRHGSLAIDDVRPVANAFGFDVQLGQRAQRLQVRTYDEVPVG